MSGNQTQNIISSGERMVLSTPLTEFDPYEISLIYKDGSFLLIKFNNAESVTHSQLERLNKFNSEAVSKIEEILKCKLG
ncbi:hypothetical protein [Yersinia enterocolitica]|uniref:Uncharacterized protein n=1 Tax=Yersinia enterocolitica TaxID=630 RepID=A0ABP1YBV4_YEREN|nr:hypothetical protein [Yersinia enterocolitica]CNE47516.1 Uncharacterised protein [Yersinia enterocolitica]CQD62242.1 Uncharacterised protein [Yersinia enterocolitica]CRX79456.1 Uncharacterised protein [Yersinia enterocolitica]